MYSSQHQKEEAPFYDERAGIISELHAIVDNLQPDPPPQVELPRKPFWQRAGVWQVPLCLVALAIILMYNPRVDNCNGFKITYKRQVLCISNDADFFLFVENFTCDFVENGKSVVDSLVADEAVKLPMQAYFEKHNFSIKKQPIEAEVLRGMRGQYDSASFCKNLTKAYWNVGIRLLNKGQKDSACSYFIKIEAWSWGDSVLTAVDKSVISNNCHNDFLQNQERPQTIFQQINQDTAKGLNAINNRLNNINNVLQNRVNQRENRNKTRIIGNDSPVLQRQLPIVEPLKTYVYYTNGTSERDISKLVKLENLEEIIVNNNIYDNVDISFVLRDDKGVNLWKINPRVVQVLKDSTLSVKIDKAILSKYLAGYKYLYLDEDVSGQTILSWPLRKATMKK